MNATTPIETAPAVTFVPVGSYSSGFGEGSGESVAYGGGRIFVTNGIDNSLDIVALAPGGGMSLVRRVPLGAYGASPSSVAVSGALVAVGVIADPKTDPGRVAFFDVEGTARGSVVVGANPDMVAFTPDGKRVLVANEGEPNSYGEPDSVDPEGSISIVNTAPYRAAAASRRPVSPNTVRTAGFGDFNEGASRHGALPAGIRLNGPNATVAQDLEPEYIAVSEDGRTAWVSLQEANALAVVDIARARVTAILALGTKDHSLPGNGLDASDRDNIINIARAPVRGMYMPDAITTFSAGGATYIATANEGDARDWPGFIDEARVNSLALDPVAFPNAKELQDNANLGRLTVSVTDGLNAEGIMHEALYSYGARSVSIWNASTGMQVWDSGDTFEQVMASAVRGAFNASNNSSEFDNRSDNKGPEPEAVETGVIDGRTYLFVGLERAGGFMVFDASEPASPRFVQWANNRDYTSDPAGPDVGPEIIEFVGEGASPTGAPIVIVGNEISGTVTVYEAREPSLAGTLSLLHNNDGESSLLPIEYGTSAGALSVGGAAAFKRVLDDQLLDARAAGNSALTVYAGDAILASAALACSLPPNPATTPIYDGLAQRLMAYDAHILGNHEFDFSPDLLERFIREFAADGVLTHPFLSANLDFTNEPGFADLIDPDGIIVGETEDGAVVARSYLHIDPTTGARLGVVGATTPLLPTISSPRGVTVTPTLEETRGSVQAEIDRLWDEHGVRKIVFVSHLQSLDNDRELIATLRRVDIAVGGGGDELLVGGGVPTEQQVLPGESQAPAGPYPLEVADADGRTVYLVTTAGNYKYLGRLDAVFGGDGEVADIIVESSYPRRVIPDEQGTADILETLGVQDAVTPDEGIVELVQAPLEDCLAQLADPLAGTDVLLNVARGAATLNAAGLTITTPGVRASETNAGNLITDSYLAAYDTYAPAAGLPARGATVIAVQNGGGIRQNAGNVLPTDGVAPGATSREDTLNVLSFLSNTITVVEDVTPAQLKAIFERSAAVPGGGQFLQVAGVEIVLDYAGQAQSVSSPPSGEQAGSITADGARVRSITLADGTPIVAEYAVVAAAPSVTIVTNSFTAAGGDNFPPFEDNTARVNLPLTYEQALVEYLLTLPVSSIDGVTLPTVQDDDPRYTPGGEGRIILEFND